MVEMVGLEPTRLAATAPKTVASASSATSRLVRAVGFEPTRVTSAVFETDASAIPPRPLVSQQYSNYTTEKLETKQ